MKLTKKQREEVVMLLRCAADANCCISDAAADLNMHTTFLPILAAWAVAHVPGFPINWSHHRYMLLEAAALVEEGRAP